MNAIANLLAMSDLVENSVLFAQALVEYGAMATKTANNQMPYSAKAVANFFLDVADEHEQPVSPMKLQKLVYYGHGWLLGIANDDLIDEPVEAWKFGPVIRSLYREFIRFGNSPITERAVHLTGGQEIDLIVPSIYDNDQSWAKEIDDFLRRVWEIYGKYTAIQLSNATHAIGSPWHHVWEQYGGNLPRNVVIPREVIRDHFAAQVKK